MLPKPVECVGCPAYGNGKGFVPDEIVPGATTFVLGEKPSRDDELKGVVKSGKAGQWEEQAFFPLAGLTRNENVSIGNLVKCRWTDDNGKKVDKWPKPTILKDIIEHCANAHLRIPPETTLVLAAGDVAWNYLGNGVGPLIGKGEEDESGKWRGYLAPNPRLGIATLGILPTGDLFKKRRFLVPTQYDWQKVKLIRNGSWPLPIPPCPNESNRAAFFDWFDFAETCQYVVCDTEFDRYTKALVLVGFGGFNGNEFRGLQFRWPYREDLQDIFSLRLRELSARVPFVFHNAMADVPVLEQATGVGYKNYTAIEDTLLAHAVLYSEWPHDLEFVDSLCGKHTKLKHLSETDPLLYNWGDVLSTHYAWEWCKKEFQKDPASEQIYRTQSLRLYEPRLEAKRDGIKVNKEKVIELFGVLGERQRAASLIAQAYCGYPVNLGSPEQLKYWVYDREGMPVQKNKSTKKAGTGEDEISVLRRLYHDYDPEDEKAGLDVYQCLQYIEEGGHPLLEARAMYAGAAQIISHYLKPLLKDEPKET